MSYSSTMQFLRTGTSNGVGTEDPGTGISGARRVARRPKRAGKFRADVVRSSGTVVRGSCPPGSIPCDDYDAGPGRMFCAWSPPGKCPSGASYMGRRIRKGPPRGCCAKPSPFPGKNCCDFTDCGWFNCDAVSSVRSAHVPSKKGCCVWPGPDWPQLACCDTEDCGWFKCPSGDSLSAPSSGTGARPKPPRRVALAGARRGKSRADAIRLKAVRAKPKTTRACPEGYLKMYCKKWDYSGKICYQLGSFCTAPKF